MDNRTADLARFVASARKVKNLTFKQIHQRGGPSSTWLSMLENGQMLDMPKVSTLRRLASALGVPLNDLMRIVDYPDQELESASDRNHGNHDQAMVLRVVASGDSGQNHGGAPIIGETSEASEGIGGPGGQLKYVGEVVAVPILGAAACGEPIEAIMDRATEYLYLPPALAHGAHAAIAVHGDSMSGAGIMSGDHVLVVLADGIKPSSGKYVVVRTSEGFACKRYREDDLGVYLEEQRTGEEAKRVRYDEAQLVGVVVGLNRSM